MILSFLFALQISNAVAAETKPSRAVEWSGEYDLQEASNGGEEMWASHLTVENCNETSCKYSYSSGSAQSDCGSEGTFSFKSAKFAEDKIEVKPDDEESPRGQCVLSFEKRKSGGVYVDAKDVFKTKKDEALGNPCNSLCGFQGARYFGIELPKVSDTKFSHPSFSCNGAKLSKIEKQICSSETLAEKDRALSDRIAKIKSREPKRVAKLTTEQRAWLKERDKTCVEAKTLESCLTTLYEARLKALQAP